MLIVLRADLKAAVEQTAAELKAIKMLELEDLKRRLEAEKWQSLDISSIAEKVKA